MMQGIGIIELGKRWVRGFFGHRMSTYAAALAYRALFGLFPFVLILVVLAGIPRGSKMSAATARSGPNAAFAGALAVLCAQHIIMAHDNIDEKVGRGLPLMRHWPEVHVT
jgi:uncharacterized BrkB/YihY/UPF0761 family membrane protein